MTTLDKVCELLEKELKEGSDLPKAHHLMGWICPKCRRSLSPYTSECWCIGNHKITS